MAKKNNSPPVDVSRLTYSRKNAKDGNRTANSNRQQLDDPIISEHDDDDAQIYTPPKAGSRYLPLAGQPSDTRAVIQGTIGHATASSLFIDAYPVIPCGDTYYRDT